jgi:hypothetical protein
MGDRAHVGVHYSSWGGHYLEPILEEAIHKDWWQIHPNPLSTKYAYNSVVGLENKVGGWKHCKKKPKPELQYPSRNSSEVARDSYWGDIKVPAGSSRAKNTCTDTHNNDVL